MKAKRNLKSKARTVKGFTLVELIVVIAIIGVLAAILIPTLFGRVKESRLATANDGAAKLAEQAAIVASDLEAKGTDFKSGDGQVYYAADPEVPTAIHDASDNFISELVKALPSLSDADHWAVKFGENGSIKAAVYVANNYVGLYPVKATEKRSVPDKDAGVTDLLSEAERT